jgi:hypothetical protein
MKKSQNMLVWLSKQNGFGLALLHSLVSLVNGTQGAPAREDCNDFHMLFLLFLVHSLLLELKKIM